MNITYKEVEKARGAEAREVWNKICAIGGFGTVLPEHSGGLDVSGLSEGKKERIQQLLVPAVEEMPAKTKKEGVK